VYRSLLRDRQALVVLDNAGPEEQVRPLLPGGGASRTLITARRLLAGLEGVRRLALEPLPPPEAVELLTGILSPRAAEDKESALDQLVELCEGMPLALRIIGNRLLSRPGWDAAELAARLVGEEHRLDQFKAGDLRIATAFGMSYQQLTDAARRIFQRLAVVPGRDFDAALAADDRMIPPSAQRAMSERAKAVVTESPGSHAVYVSHPAAVAAVISQAAQGGGGGR
jgi:hypothetical protein